MSKILGKLAKIYVNTGASYESPTWSEWECVEGVTIGITKEELNRTCRGEATNGGFNRYGIGNGEMDLSGTALKNKDDATFLVVETAMQDDTALDVVVLDGAIDSDDSDGWRLPVHVTAWSEGQPIDDYIAIDWTLKPASSTEAVTTFSGSSS